MARAQADRRHSDSDLGMVLDLMTKPRLRGPTTQKSVSLPVHVWELLDEVSDLQSEAYVLMGGKSRYSVSDLIETAATMYIRTLIQEFGDLPISAPAATRKEFVKRLAESNKRQLLEQLLEPKD